VSAPQEYGCAGREARLHPAGVLRERAARELIEVFYVIALNSQSRVIAIQEVTRGILNSSLVHAREVFRLAIAFGAAGIIVAHNHPSGDPTPSADDRAITRQLVDAGRLLDIPVYDHLVLSAARYLSFAEAGLL
jgi:DNA repair protein RadC